jgi:arylsulfatase A
MRSPLTILTLVLTALCAAAGPGLATETRRPTIVFILIDDQGYYDLGCYGATEFATPRIDAMAAQGVRFTDYYAAAPICSPSRAGLLTGCYPRRIGMETWVQRADSKRGIHPNELTIAELLRANGYSTACIGKWHLGFAPPCARADGSSPSVPRCNCSISKPTPVNWSPSATPPSSASSAAWP